MQHILGKVLEWNISFSLIVSDILDLILCLRIWLKRSLIRQCNYVAYLC